MLINVLLLFFTTTSISPSSTSSTFSPFSVFSCIAIGQEIVSAMNSAVLEMFGKTSTSLAILADFTMSLRHYSLKNGEISFFICTFA